MWPKVHGRLKSYVPVMIGLGAIIIVIDALVLVLHRLVGLDKGTALYFSILIFVGVSCLLFRRQLAAHLTRNEAESDEGSHYETSARE